MAPRTFLFELLCFAGEYTRAEKQLAVLSSGSPEKETGAIVYYAALHAEKTRHELFEKEDFPADSPASPPGELNGKPFTELRDADPDIGARLEVFAAGAYVWLPSSTWNRSRWDRRNGCAIRCGLRRWSRRLPPSKAWTSEKCSIPAIYPFSWKQQDEEVWLGRITEWLADEQGRESPTGQKMLLVDGEEFPVPRSSFAQVFPSGGDAGRIGGDVHRAMRTRSKSGAGHYANSRRHPCSHSR